MQTYRFALLSLCLILPLTACQSGVNSSTHKERSAKINNALEQAADHASATGNTRESLSFLERMYKRDSANPETVMKYAKALRESGRINRAALILSAFMTNPDAKIDAAILSENAALQAEIGNYHDAEKYARQAIEMDSELYRPYHVLGIALDAQSHHDQAEDAFRMALDRWEGDPSPILNNLGLNLASQGFIDEALDVLRKAAAAAPTRTEIERNLRIVSALQTQPPKQGTRIIPMPPRKPKKDG